MSGKGEPVLEEYSDLEIMALVIKGNKDKYAFLVQRYQQPAYKLALTILRHTADAEDAVSEAFIKAYSALPKCREGTNFKSWLLKITYNCCQDILRKRKYPLSFEDESTAEYAAPDNPLASVIQKEEKTALWEALRKLTPEDRAAFILKYHHDFSYQSISETLKWPLGTVASRLSRTRGKLRLILEGGLSK